MNTDDERNGGRFAPCLIVALALIFVGLNSMCSPESNNRVIINPNRSGELECALRWGSTFMFAIVPDCDTIIDKVRIGSHVDKDTLRQENVTVLVNEFRYDTIVVHPNEVLTTKKETNNADSIMKKMSGFIRMYSRADYSDYRDYLYIGQMVNGKLYGFGTLYTNYYYKHRISSRGPRPLEYATKQVGLWKDDKPVHIRTVSQSHLYGHPKDKEYHYLYSVDQDEYSLFPSDVSQVEFTMSEDSTFVYNDMNITRNNPLYSEFMRMKSTLDEMESFGYVSWGRFGLTNNYIKTNKLYEKSGLGAVCKYMYSHK